MTPSPLFDPGLRRLRKVDYNPLRSAAARNAHSVPPRFSSTGFYLDCSRWRLFQSSELFGASSPDRIHTFTLGKET